MAKYLAKHGCLRNVGSYYFKPPVLVDKQVSLSLKKTGVLNFLVAFPQIYLSYPASTVLLLG